MIESFKNAFKDLQNLREIKFPTDKKVNPKNVENMFSGCSSLTSLDLSIFDLRECESFTEMINGCTALRNLILHDFYFKDEYLVNTIFLNGIDLYYLDIYNAKGATETIKNSKAITESLQVCQSEFIIPTKLEICCEGVCKVNFIEIYYKEACVYESGGFKVNSDFREMDFMLKHNNDIFESTTGFSISNGDKLEIYFAQSPTSLEKFFSEEIDPNMKNVYSIDFSNLIATSLTNINSLFYKSSSIESITFDCDLSSVTDMSNLFNGCSSLKALYLPNFKISSETTTTDMFKDVNELSYLDIRNLKDEKSGLSSMKEKNLIVCKDNYLDFTSDNWKYICCDYNTNIDNCESSNYISVQYESSIEIKKFGNNHRNELLFLMIKNQIYDLIETFTVEENEKLELHFTHAIGSLENFFDNEADTTTI